MYLFISGRKWFVSKNGTDLSNCGKDEQNACASFRAVWPHIVDDKSMATDNIVQTDTNLFIESMQLQSLHKDHKRLIFENRASHVINITIINTTMDNTHLRFSWFGPRSISLYIENCYIRSSLIYIRLSQPVVINNCTFHGDTRTDNTTSPEVTSRNKRRNEYLFIDCWLSNITIVNMVVRDNVGRGMSFESCNVQITDSHFTNNGVIMALIEGIYSELKIENSHFLNNTNTYGTIRFHLNSKVHVTNSTFTGNKGETAGGIILYENSKANVINSTLTGNQGEYAWGIILVNSEANVISTLIENNAGGIYLYKSEAHIINSTLTGNQGHALLVMKQSRAITTGCQFLDNAEKGQGAAVHVSERSEYHDQRSSFAGNLAEEGGRILSKKKTFFEILKW